MKGRRLAWTMALRNLRRNGRRNLVSGLAIAFGFAGMTLMGSYITRVDTYLAVNTVYINHTGHVSVYRQDGIERHLTRPAQYTLTPEDQSKIAALVAEFPEVEFTGRYLVGMGLANNGCFSMPFFSTGIEDGLEERLRSHPEVLRSTPELTRTLRGKRIGEYQPALPDAISLTRSLALTLGKEKTLEEVGDARAPLVIDCASDVAKKALANDADVQLVARSLSGDFSAVDAQVVGNHTTGLQFSEDTGLITSLSLAQKLFATENITYLAAFLKPGKSVGSFASGLRARISADKLPYSVHEFYDERIGSFYLGVMNFLMTMAAFFYLLVLGMVAVTVANFITMGVIERRREIGTLRSIGFRPGQIAGLFFRESTALVAASMMGGAAIVTVVVLVVNRLGIRFRPPGIAGDMEFLLIPTPGLCVLVAALVGGIALVAAALTLRARVRDNIVSLLQG